MVVYACDKCDKIFNRKSSYDYHLKRKTSCDKKKIKNRIAEIPNLEAEFKILEAENENLEAENEKSVCGYCNKSFTLRYNMLKHVKRSCKIAKNLDEKQKMIFMKLKKLEEDNKSVNDKNRRLEDEIKELKLNQRQYNPLNNINDNSNTNINDNSNTNNTINNNNIKSMMMVGYGKEDISKLNIDRKDMIKAINKVCKAPTELARLIHLNPKHPEHHNIYIPKYNENAAMIYDDENKDWKLANKNKVIDKMYVDKKNIVEENLDHYIDLLTDNKIKRLKEWFKNVDDDVFDGEGIKEAKDEMKLMFYNNKKLGIKQKKRLEKREKN